MGDHLMHSAWNYPGFYPVHYALMRCIAEGRPDRAYRLALELAHYARAIDSRTGNWSR
jgi:hypothetical protein